MKNRFKIMINPINLVNFTRVLRRFIVITLSLCFTFFLVACSEVTDDIGEKIDDVEFTILEIEDVPEILVEQIIISKNEPFKLSLIDGSYIYIAIGYGEQETYGYSISVLDLYKTADYLVIETNLVGPNPNEKVIPQKDYPFIVIKSENIDLPICYK